MVRLVDEIISGFKQNESLLWLVESQGHKMAKQGKNYLVFLPFHEEKPSSSIISPKQSF